MKKRNIYSLIAGQFISVFSSAMLRFALSLYILDVTGRADAFATILALTNLPILLSPIGGVIADRYDRKVLMVLMDIGNGLFSAALLFCLGGKTGSIIAITALLMVLSFIGNFDTPVVVACIPFIVEDQHLERVNGLVNGVVALSNVVAPIVGGIVYGFMGVRSMIIWSSLFFLVAAVIESGIKIPKIKKDLIRKSTVFSELVQGFNEIKSNSIISKAIFITVLLNFILTSFCIVGVPTILRVTLNTGDWLYGVGMGVVSGSTIFGAILSGKLSKSLTLKNLYKLLGIMFLLTVFLNIGINFFPSNLRFATLVVAIIPIGASAAVISIYLTSMIQRKTKPTSLGRVMSTSVALSQCALPLGQMVIGFLIENVGETIFLPMLFINISMLVIVFISKQLLGVRT